MADAETKEAPAAPSGGSSKLVPIMLVVNMLLVGGVLALFLLKGGSSKGSEAKPAAEAAAGHGDEAGAPGPTAKMADFVVHLRDAEADRYARISFEVELATEADKARFERYLARIRDGFISFLSDRTLEELRGSEPVGKVKAALQDRLRELAPGVKIRALYITDLVIQ